MLGTYSMDRQRLMHTASVGGEHTDAGGATLIELF
jgi:hypothetical protein